jgi:hypothetical protein
MAIFTKEGGILSGWPSTFALNNSILHLEVTRGSIHSLREVLKIALRLLSRPQFLLKGSEDNKIQKLAGTPVPPK